MYNAGEDSTGPFSRFTRERTATKSPLRDSQLSDNPPPTHPTRSTDDVLIRGGGEGVIPCDLNSLMEVEAPGYIFETRMTGGESLVFPPSGSEKKMTDWDVDVTQEKVRHYLFEPAGMEEDATCLDRAMVVGEGEHSLSVYPHRPAI